MGWLDDINWGDAANLGLTWKMWEDMRKDLKSFGTTAQTGAKELGEEAADYASFKPFTVTSGAGTAKADFGTGEATYYTEDDEAAGTIPEGSAIGDVKKEAYTPGLTLGLSDEQEVLRKWLETQTGTFQDYYGDEYGTEDWRATKEQDIYDRIRATMLPEEERQRLDLEQRLLGQGRLGTETSMFGGTPEQLSLAKAQEEAKLQAMLAAMTRASTEQQEDFGNIGQALGMSYAPDQFLLSTLAPATNLASIADLGRRAGAGYQAETGMSGLDAALQAQLGRGNLTGQLMNALLQGPGGTSKGGLFGEIFEDVGGGLFDWLRDKLGF